MEGGEGVVLVVGTDRLPASRLQLAAHSDYFQAMFQQEFTERGQAEVELQGLPAGSVRELVAWAATGPEGPLDHWRGLPTERLLELLEAAGMLQFQVVHAACLELLEARLHTDCLEILGPADRLGERSLLAAATEFALCHFSRLAGERGGLCTGACDMHTLRRLLENPRLNCTQEDELEAALGRWAAAREPAEAEAVPELLACWRAVERRLPLYPCVVGQRRAARGDLLSRGTEGGVGCKRGLAALLVFLPESGRLVEVPGLEEGGRLEPTGCQVVARGHEVVVSGGEVHLGHSRWSHGVWAGDSLQGWREAGQLESGRRHHAAVLCGDWLYLVGGYGRHRDPLASVERVHLASGRAEPCAALPRPCPRPCAALWQGRLVALLEAGELEGALGEVVAYCPARDRWDHLLPLDLPPGAMPCSRAVAAPGGGLLLTSTSSRQLLMLPPAGGVRTLGQFSREAGNTCLVGGSLFNFSAEEFGDERVVESYNIETGQFRVLLQEELPHWDFSPAPQYSYGCFPLLAYRLQPEASGAP
jgi:hypothetical protein